MQISLKFIWAINQAKSTACIKFQLLVIFSSLFTDSSSLSVFPRSVLYHYHPLEADFPTFGGDETSNPNIKSSNVSELENVYDLDFNSHSGTHNAAVREYAVEHVSAR